MHDHSHPTSDASQTDPDPHQAGEALRDISEVASVEIITTACVHLMSAAAVKLGLAEDEETGQHQDLAEARKLINALAGLVTAEALEIGNEQARSLRAGVRSMQLALAEALPLPDEPGQGPGEKCTGRVFSSFGSANRPSRPT